MKEHLERVTPNIEARLAGAAMFAVVGALLRIRPAIPLSHPLQEAVRARERVEHELNVHRNYLSTRRRAYRGTTTGFAA